MGTYSASVPDTELLRAFEACEIPQPDWDHRAHVRVAWMCLESSADFEEAAARMRQGVVASNRATEARGEALKGGYHETLTRCWLRLIERAMGEGDGAGADDSRAFVESCPHLLDFARTYDHYSAERLWSAEACKTFVEPDRAPLPKPAPAHEAV